MKIAKPNWIKLSIFFIRVILSTGIIFLLGLFIKVEGNYSNLQDVLTVLGLLVTAFAALTFVGGNPNGPGISLIGQSNVDSATSFTLSVIQEERKLTDYFKNFKKQNALSFEHIKLEFLLSGITTLIICIFIL
jgi:hypothetical protein